MSRKTSSKILETPVDPETLEGLALRASDPLAGFFGDEFGEALGAVEEFFDEVPDSEIDRALMQEVIARMLMMLFSRAPFDAEVIGIRAWALAYKYAPHLFGPEHANGISLREIRDKAKMGEGGAARIHYHVGGLERKMESFGAAAVKGAHQKTGATASAAYRERSKNNHNRERHLAAKAGRPVEVKTTKKIEI